MKLITWNVQWCRGVDQKVDPARVIATAVRLADFDVLCLQEIADNYPDPLLAGSEGEDQFALLASLLPGFTAVPGVAVDQISDEGPRRRFGNMILSRLPVKQAYRHLLPYPADHGVPSMPRVAVEAVVEAPFGDVRVITTHLEYYSVKKRSAQVEGLRAIYAEGFGYANNPRIATVDEGPYQALPRPAATIITGDFNLEPDDPCTRGCRRRSPTAPRRWPMRGRSHRRELLIRRPFAFTRKPSPAIRNFTAISSSSAKICGRGCDRSMSIRRRRFPTTSR